MLQEDEKKFGLWSTKVDLPLIAFKLDGVPFTNPALPLAISTSLNDIRENLTPVIVEATSISPRSVVFVYRFSALEFERFLAGGERYIDLAQVTGPKRYEVIAKVLMDTNGLKELIGPLKDCRAAK